MECTEPDKSCSIPYDFSKDYSAVDPRNPPVIRVRPVLESIRL